MRCGRQDPKTRGHVRRCLGGKGEAPAVCSYRGRERYCSLYQRERRPSESRIAIAGDWQD